MFKSIAETFSLFSMAYEADPADFDSTPTRPTRDSEVEENMFRVLILSDNQEVEENRLLRYARNDEISR